MFLRLCFYLCSGNTVQWCTLLIFAQFHIEWHHGSLKVAMWYLNQISDWFVDLSRLTNAMERLLIQIKFKNVSIAITLWITKKLRKYSSRIKKKQKNYYLTQQSSQIHHWQMRVLTYMFNHFCLINVNENVSWHSYQITLIHQLQL